MISCSLDWNIEEEKLKRVSRNVAYSGEVRRLIENIRIDVKKLSRAEVEARRTRKDCGVNEILKKINADIELVEEYILVAALLGQS